jgi:trk system potassium uptake protein TrkH
MGFLVVLDLWNTATGRTRHLGFTSKVILSITLWFLVLGTAALALAEPALAALPADQRLLSAFFQAMSAATTVGFDSVPIGSLSPAVLLVIVVLMLFGASPAGTGGGLKTTTFAALLGLVRSTLKGRRTVRYMKRPVPPERLQAAAAGLAYYGVLLFLAMFVLLQTESGATFESLLFEAVSAMGTVGLSTGVTGGLSDLGKLVVAVLMVAGRVGILSFGIALARHDESREEERDNELVI